MKFLSWLVTMLCLTLVACGETRPPTSPLPFIDDFSNPQSGWQTNSDLTGDATFDNGRLRIIVKQQSLTVWSMANKVFKDATYEVDAQPIGGPQDNGFGVLFRAKDRKNFYHFEISSDGYWRAGVMKDSKWENWADWLPNPAIKTGGEVNRIKVVMKGEAFNIFVNNQLVVSRENEKLFDAGDIGVFALTVIDQPGTDVVFDNVSVTEIK
jgi:hypothetical protein